MEREEGEGEGEEMQDPILVVGMPFWGGVLGGINESGGEEVGSEIWVIWLECARGRKDGGNGSVYGWRLGAERGSG